MCDEKLSPKFTERCVRDGKCVIFEEMYVILFKFFDEIWVKKNGHYMMFREILQETEARINKVLEKNPSSYDNFIYWWNDL